jgi:DNA (cytosine-5)-methyltransferase 1
MKSSAKKITQQVPNKPAVLDLFAGCGGLSEGLTRAGFDIRWANELWGPAANTFRSSHPNTLLFQEDASLLLQRFERGDPGLPSKGEVDLIAGGPPCQGFSGFNRHRSPNDPRNSMIDIFLGFVKHLSPSMVLMENVPGLLTLNEGKLAELLLASFDELGYSSKVGLLQGGYYGLPQNRWRTFIIAVAKGIDLPSYPLPTHEFDRVNIHASGSIKVAVDIIKPSVHDNPIDRLKRVTVGDTISDLPSLGLVSPDGTGSYASKPLSEYQKVLRQHSTFVRDHICPKIEPVTLERICAVPHKPGAGWLDLPPNLQPLNLKKYGDNRYPNRYGRLDWSGVFNTILTRPHPYWSRVIHPIENRLLSVRECARAQSFSDSTVFSGTISDKFKQIGNAVPPLLAEVVGKMIVASWAFGQNRS